MRPREKLRHFACGFFGGVALLLSLWCLTLGLWGVLAVVVAVLVKIAAEEDAELSREAYLRFNRARIARLGSTIRPLYILDSHRRHEHKFYGDELLTFESLEKGQPR